MTLSVTSATGALAALQALSAQTSTTPSTSGLATTAASATPTAHDIVQASGGQAPGAQGLGPLMNGISQAVTAADAASAAGQTVVGLLQQMRDAAGVAAHAETPADQRAVLDGHFQSGAAGIGEALSGATVNGVNLIDGSRRAGLKVSLGDGAAASLTPTDLSLGGSKLGISTALSIATATAASSAFSSLGQAIGVAGAALAGLQGQADQISAHAGAVQTLAQAIPSSGDDDGVRLMALQLGQQLSGQSSAIANQSPQAILALFRS